MEINLNILIDLNLFRVCQIKNTFNKLYIGNSIKYKNLREIIEDFYSEFING